MAGFPYHNLSTMFNQLNQAMQSNSLNQLNQQPGSSQYNQQPAPSHFNQQPYPNQYNQQQDSTLQNIQAARELLNTVIPAPSGAFIQNPAGTSHVTNVTKTSSRITLPPSMASKRQKKQTGNAIAEMPSSESSANVLGHQVINTSGSLSLPTVPNRHIDSGRIGVDGSNGPSASTQQLPTFDILASKNVTEPEDPPAPVFSTELGMGKEFLASKSEPVLANMVLEPSNTRNKLFPHGAHRILHDNDHWHKFIVSV